MSDEQYQVDRFARDLARRLAKLERAQRRTARASGDLRHSALDHGARLPIKDEDGNTTGYLGSGPNGIEHVGGPVPEQPAAPFVDAGGEAVKVQLSGLDVHGDPAPSDFRRALVHASLDEEFEPSLSSLSGHIEEPNGSLTHRLPGGEWWVRVVWETLSGKTSTPSAAVLADVAPLVDADEIEADLAAANERMDAAQEYTDGQFSAFGDRMESAETDLDDAHDRIDAAEGFMAPLPGDIAAANAAASAAQSAADQAVQDALDAADLADGKGQVIPQVSAPTGSRARVENLWVRLPDMKVHYYDGTAWLPVDDPDTVLAAQNAADALAEAADLQEKYDQIELLIDGEDGIQDRLDTALTGDIDHDRLRVGAGAFDELFAQQVVAGIIGAKKASVIDLIAQDLIANNATLINAAMRNLSVTEMANFVDAFANELYAEEFTAKVATMARAIVAAPNLIPGMGDIRNTMPPPFDVTGFYRITFHPSIRITGRRNVSTSQDAPIYLEAEESYAFQTDVQGSVPGTRYYIQLLGDGDVTVEGSSTSYLLANRTAPSGSWGSESVEFSVSESGPYRLYFYANHSNGANNDSGYQWFRGLTIRNMLDGTLTVPGSIDAGAMNVNDVTAAVARVLHLFVDQLDANSIWADQTWQAAGYFGSTAADTMVRIDGTGYTQSALVQDGDGTSHHAPIINLGSSGDGNHYSTIDPATGETLSAITEDGDGTFQTVRSVNDPEIQGTTLVGNLPELERSDHGGEALLDNIGWGQVAYTQRNNQYAGAHQSGELGVLELVFQAYPGRRYQIDGQTGVLQGHGGRLGARLRHATSGAFSVSSNTIAYDAFNTPNTQYQTMKLTGFINGPETGDQPETVHVLLSIDSQNSFRWIDGDYNKLVTLTATDVGPRRTWSGVHRSTWLRVDTGSAPSEPTPDPAVTRTGRWAATSMASYMSGGGSRQNSGAGTNRMRQGYDPYWPGGGRQTGIFLLSKSGISTALAGSNVTRARLRLTISHTYLNRPSTLRLYWHSSTSLPGSYNPGASFYIGSHTVTPGQTLVLDLPAAVRGQLAAGNVGGFGFSPGSSNSSQYRVDVSYANRPRLDVTYRR